MHKSQWVFGVVILGMILICQCKQRQSTAQPTADAGTVPPGAEESCTALHRAIVPYYLQWKAEKGKPGFEQAPDQVFAAVKRSLEQPEAAGKDEGSRSLANDMGGCVYNASLIETQAQPFDAEFWQTVDPVTE